MDNLVEKKADEIGVETSWVEERLRNGDLNLTTWILAAAIGAALMHGYMEGVGEGAARQPTADTPRASLPL
jgi:hypothetical protein